MLIPTEQLLAVSCYNPASPHSLRHAFKSVLHSSELIRDVDVEYFMGHKGKATIEHTYTTIELDGWRKIYSQGLSVLEPSFILTKVHNGKVPIAL